MCLCAIGIFSTPPLISYVHGAESDGTPNEIIRSTRDEVQPSNLDTTQDESVDTPGIPGASQNSSSTPSESDDTNISISPKTPDGQDKTTLQIIFEFLAALLGGRKQSSEQELRDRCSALPEIEQYLAENPEYSEQSRSEIDALKKECSNVNVNVNDGGDLDPSGDLNLDQSTPIPSGRCSNLATAAIKKVTQNKYLIDTYKKASEATDVPWEILAAIHYVEAGNNPNNSLISGRPIGFPEPDQGMNRYSSLLESAIRSADVYKEKRRIAMSSTGTGPDDFETLVGTFARYNGPGNSQCTSSNPKALAPGYDGCPAKFEFEDHIYPLACYDKRHEDMYVIYCGDRRLCARPTLYSNIGALTFIKALRDEIDPPQIGPLNRSPGSSVDSLPGLIYYPQCNGSLHSAPWSNLPMKDARGNIIYGTNKGGDIVQCSYCKASCGLAASAMIVSSYTNQSINPVRFLASYNTSQSMTCGGAYLPILGTTLKKYGITVGGHIAFDKDQGYLTNDLFIKKAKSYLQNGWTLLTLGYFNGGGHYVWIVGIDAQNRFLIYDPYWGVSSPLPFNSKNYGSARITYITPVRK